MAARMSEGGTGRACPADDPKAAKRARSSAAWHAGASAEESVRRLYERRGLTLAAHRWRGGGGEIDLILTDGSEVIFVEVKSSRTHGAAAESLRPRQAARLVAAAEEYLGTLPRGSLTPCRFDLATVDRRGDVRVIKNAVGF